MGCNHMMHKDSEDVVMIRKIYGAAETRKTKLELERLKFVANDYAKIKEMIEDDAKNESRHNSND